MARQPRPPPPSTAPNAVHSAPLTADCVTLEYPCFLARSGKLLFLPPFAMANTPSTAKRPAEPQDATSPAQPVATVRYGDVSAAIFADVVPLPTGAEVTTHRVSLRRSYRDQQANEWKHTHRLGDSDLLPAAEALRKCFEIIAERRRS